MQAISISAFGGPGVMRLHELPTPLPDARQVLVKIEAAGVNPVDAYIRSGLYPVRPQLPYVPGFDAAGTVAAQGREVRHVTVGDRVWVTSRNGGAYAEYGLFQAGEVHPLPERVSFLQGSAVGVPAGAAWRALFLRGEGRAGESVLVHGASGSVGLAAVQLGRAAGMKVFGTAGSDAGSRLVLRQEPMAIFDHRQDGYADQILAATDGRGLDLIVEMLANVNLERDLALLAPRGRVVIVGSRGRIEIDPRATMGRELEVRGLSLFAASEAEAARTHAALCAALATGILQPVVHREMPLFEAPRAHQEVLESPSLGKTVLVP